MRYNKHHLYMCFFCVGILSVLACKKNKEWDIHNLNGGRISVIGHAGSGLNASDHSIRNNTFLSIKNAVELYGAAGVEMDVHISNDSVFYLLHDQTLEVSTNMQGCTYEYTSKELNECYYNYSNEKLTQLENCLQHFSLYTIKPKVFLDTRLYSPCNVNNYVQFIQEYSNAIYSLVDKYNAYSWTYIESRDSTFLRMLQNKSTQFHLVIDGYICSELDIAVKMNLSGIVVQNDFITKEEIELAHSKNIPVILYGAENKQQTIEAIKKSPDMIQTDNILMLKQLLNQ